jgi:hypothetical protein
MGEGEGVAELFAQPSILIKIIKWYLHDCCSKTACHLKGEEYFQFFSNKQKRFIYLM